jgi:glucose/arabinose dehydrogenase
VLKRSLLLVALLCPAAAAAADPPKVLASGLKNPESVAVGPNGRVYATVIGEFDKDGDGAVVLVENGKATPVVTGLDDPKGLAAFAQWLFVADKTKVLRIDTRGRRADLFAPANAFPSPPKFLNDLAVDPESGMLYVSDCGDFQGNGAAVYRITPQGLVSLVADGKTIPGLKAPNGLTLDGASHLLVADFGTGQLHRVKLSTGASEKIADGLGGPDGGADGLAWDMYGRLYVSDWKHGKVFVIPRPGDEPVLLADGFQQAADLCLAADRKTLLVPDMKAGTILALSPTVPGAEVDESPLPLKMQLAFADVTWAGWDPEGGTGKVEPFRPILLTHAGDGSDRVFVPTQQGVIHVIKNTDGPQTSKVFLDLRDKVKYSDNTNEEGFLGLAFHPKFKQTGEFFVFYTPKNAKVMTNVVSRFRVKQDDPDAADPASEEEIYRFEKPFWNHDGGTILFGPDGYLYFTHGDGGAANDLYDNGQKLSSPLGKILRIDVNSKADGKNYAIPKDNPFVGVKDALPEVYAYGFRNIWRMAFDRQTGDLWAADVGQNLYEEINLVKKGGNYGWNRREALHPFGARGVGPNKDMIDPIWEYHHDIGKSITGGTVYRGKKVPELAGYYLYGDYVTNRLWALKYDAKQGRVVENRPIPDPAKPVFTFGEDEQGEVYMLTSSPNGKGIYRFGR